VCFCRMISLVNTFENERWKSLKLFKKKKYIELLEFNAAACIAVLYCRYDVSCTIVLKRFKVKSYDTFQWFTRVSPGSRCDKKKKKITLYIIVSRALVHICARSVPMGREVWGLEVQGTQYKYVVVYTECAFSQV